MYANLQKEGKQSESKLKKNVIFHSFSFMAKAHSSMRTKHISKVFNENHGNFDFSNK